MILTGLGNQNLVVFSQTPVTVKQGICCSCNENCIILLVYDQTLLSRYHCKNYLILTVNTIHVALFFWYIITIITVKITLY